MKYEIDIFHYLSIYKRHWKRMAFLIVAAVSITAMVESMQPVTYRSTVTLLSLERGGKGGGLGSYLGLPPLYTSSSSEDIIITILKSRRMREDIKARFNLKDKPKLWWTLDAYRHIAGLLVEVEGPDPQMTKEMANFAVDDLDKINVELEVTSQKPMVKVLDRAIEGVPIGGSALKKTIASGLFTFLIYALFIFFKEYFSQLNKSRKKQ